MSQFHAFQWGDGTLWGTTGIYSGKFSTINQYSLDVAGGETPFTGDTFSLQSPNQAIWSPIISNSTLSWTTAGPSNPLNTVEFLNSPPSSTVWLPSITNAGTLFLTSVTPDPGDAVGLFTDNTNSSWTVAVKAVGTVLLEPLRQMTSWNVQDNNLVTWTPAITSIGTVTLSNASPLAPVLVAEFLDTSTAQAWVPTISTRGDLTLTGQTDPHLFVGSLTDSLGDPWTFEVTPTPIPTVLAVTGALSSLQFSQLAWIHRLSLRVTASGFTNILAIRPIIADTQFYNSGFDCLVDAQVQRCSVKLTYSGSDPLVIWQIRPVAMIQPQEPIG